MIKQFLFKKLTFVLLVVAGCAIAVLATRAIWIARADAKSLHRDHQKEIAIWFEPDKTEVCLHPPQHSGTANVHFELLDNTNKVIAEAQQTANLANDTHITTTLPFALMSLDDYARSIFKWNRLRYTISVDGKSRMETVQIADALPNQFVFRVTAPEHVEPDTIYHVATHAENSDSQDSVAGVVVSASLKEVGKESVLGKGSATTNADGQASFGFKIGKDSPRAAVLALTAFNDGDFETQLVGVSIAANAAVTISTDKPLYQPGQTVHCRTLLLGQDSHRAQADLELKMVLRNEKRETVATATERTDRFGVAAHDFELAEADGLGRYSIQVTAPGIERASSFFNFDVSRYELPTFYVKAEPDKRFYLGGETAKIKLRADYLFGKPVTNGKAVIVDGNTRSNRSSKKRNAGKQFEQLLSNGQAEISIGPLKAPAQNDYQQFFDKPYSVYITDSSTGRTEETKFTLRVSREALHVYVRNELYNLRLPVEFFVSTYYPDGSPAECDVDIDLNKGKYKRTVHTNRYGLSKVATGYVLPVQKSQLYEDLPIKITAHDSHGNIGVHVNNVRLNKRSEIHLVTNRSIYRTGESLEATIMSSHSDSMVRLEVVKDSQVIAAETIKTSGGRAVIRFPANPQFEGLISLAAYELPPAQGKRKAVITDDDDDYSTVYSRWNWSNEIKTVLFPPQSRLDLNVKMGSPTVKPGQDSDVEFKITDGFGQPVETSLGVAVIDKSVSTLAEVNQKFGTRYFEDYFSSRWGSLEEVAGVKLADLMNLDFTKPVSDDLSLVAELILSKHQSRFYRSSSRDAEPNYAYLYKPIFSQMRDRVARAVGNYYTKNHKFLKKQEDLRTLFEAGGELNDLVDPWGKPYKMTIDQMEVDLARWNGKDLKEETWSTKLKRVWGRAIYASSAGHDGTFGTADDITQVVLNTPSSPIENRPIAALHGSIIQDKTESSQIRIRASQLGTNFIADTTVDKDGKFKLTTLNAGAYRVEFSVDGYIRLALVDVLLLPGTQVFLNARLPNAKSPLLVLSVNSADGGYGGVSEVITVSASGGSGSGEPGPLRVSGGVIGDQIDARQVMDLPMSSRNALDLVRIVPGLSSDKTSYGGGAGGGVGNGENDSDDATPRLRQYFPETLVWQPQLITDANGIAKLKFPMADSITTWQLAVVGSTEDGKIGTGEAEIRAFQDFFAEPQLPPTLTEGDQISLPVVVRNYTDKAQAIRVALNSADWFSLENQSSANLNIDSATAGKIEFVLKALKPGNFKARIDAIGHDASDAIEREVRVGYDGREIVTAQGDLIDSSNQYTIEIPSDAIPGSARASLKLYPNLMSSALDGVQGMTQKPWGCLEQTISSTYGNLLVLRYLKNHHPDDSKTDWAKIERKARRNLENGVQRIYTFPAAGGGYSYFGDNHPDLALTAYALKFLTDAKEFVEVQDAAIKNAQTWLVSIQAADGSWKMRGYYWDKQPRYATTAYVTEALALSGYKEAALQKAFAYLDASNKAMQDPYSIVHYAMAAEAAKDQARSAQLIDRLSAMAIKDRDGAHWGPPERTLFYGWGRGGTVEMTALAIQALAGVENRQPEQTQLMNRGLLYLARLRDRTGSWYSTQATVQAISALIKADNQSNGPSGPIRIVVNGQPVKTIDFSTGELGEDGAASLDLTKYIASGASQIGIERAGGGTLALQLVSTHFVRWDDPSAVAGQSDKFQISVATDKQNAKIGEEIKYNVAYKRSDWQSCGMSIMEIGLPPGVEVDRSSLEKQMTSYAISKYSITPDRVIFYVWPNKAEQTLTFTVKPRLAVNAKTAPSIIYDYYNPDAWRVAAPLHVVVQ